MGGLVADGDPSPVPRRSAVSSLTPPEPEPDPVMIPAPAAGAVVASPTEPATQAGSSWLQHHRRTLVIWLVGALVAVLAVVGGGYLIGRSGGNETDPLPGPTSPTVSESPQPEASVDDLIDTAGANLIVPGASWVVASTSEEASQANARAACLSRASNGVNAVIALQRTFGTSEADRLAALHQIDVYATEQAAREVFQDRSASLAACDEVPTRIVSADDVTGLADEVQQVTVAYENNPTEYHSVMLVRTGRAVMILDVVRDGEPVPTDALASALTEPLQGVCEEADGTCPGTPVAAPTVPPPSEPVGWLLTSDLPRITPGTGQWTATEPGQLTSQGMGCENMPLATEPGPADRAQRTYLLTQDDNRPTAFGVDEMVFEFNTPEEAGAFVAKLGANLANCNERVLTATVVEHPGIVGTGEGGANISARAFTIQQATSETSSVIYQLTVAVTGQKVNYLLTSVTEEYKFTDEQLAALALRGAQRLSQ